MPLSIFPAFARGWSALAVQWLTNCKVFRQSCRSRAESRPRPCNASCARQAGNRGGRGAAPPRLPGVAGPLRNTPRICEARTAKAGLQAEDARHVSRDDTLLRRTALPGHPML